MSARLGKVMCIYKTFGIQNKGYIYTESVAKTLGMYRMRASTHVQYILRISILSEKWWWGYSETFCTGMLHLDFLCPFMYQILAKKVPLIIPLPEKLPFLYAVFLK